MLFPDECKFNVWGSDIWKSEDQEKLDNGKMRIKTRKFWYLLLNNGGESVMFEGSVAVAGVGNSVFIDWLHYRSIWIFENISE